RGGDLLRRLLGLLAEPLEQHVAAERDANRADPRVWVALDEQAHDQIEIVGVAGVVEARQPVRLTATRAKVQRDRGPPRPVREHEQTTEVVRWEGACETVQDQQQRRVRCRGRVEPVQVDEVTVGRDDPLAPGARRLSARERAPHGLCVAVAQPPRGAKRYSCPVSSSFTICGAISRARRSSSASERLAIGWGIAKNLYDVSPHCSAIARPVFSNTSVTIEAEGIP